MSYSNVTWNIYEIPLGHIFHQNLILVSQVSKSNVNHQISAVVVSVGCAAAFSYQGPK